MVASSGGSGRVVLRGGTGNGCDMARGYLWTRAPGGSPTWDDAGVGIAPVELERPETDEVTAPDTPWITLVWNDPVNLMSYVTYVFMTYFGYPKEKAETLMLDVHQKGRAVVSSGSREEMERDVTAMHSYGLWATLQKDD